MTRTMTPLRKFFAAALFAVVLTAAVSASARAAETEDPLLGVREGWAWPVVVVMPPEGWDSPRGDSIKLAMRTAEREISTTREAIRGREVTFMFSDAAKASELKSRLATWRAMKVAVIVTFADDEFNSALAAMCGDWIQEKGNQSPYRCQKPAGSPVVLPDLHWHFRAPARWGAEI